MATAVPSEVSKSAPGEDLGSDVGRRMKTIDVAELVPAQSKRPRVSSVTEVARGAESVVTRISFLGYPAIKKERFAKRYRHQVLDSRLTTRRLAQEARVLLRARRAGVRVPALYFVDSGNSALIMEDVGGCTVRDFLRSADPSVAEATLRVVGRTVALLHTADIIHGDLTTSNLLVTSGHKSDVNGGDFGVHVVLIDFGLSMTSGTDEDKAVDLYVLERAVIAAHPQRADVLNDAFFDSYCKAVDNRIAMSVMHRLEDVRSRGRKRDMTG